MMDGPRLLILTKADYPVVSVSECRELLQRAIARQAASEHAIIREMLGRWVSELEPVIVRQRLSQSTEDGTIIRAAAERIVGLSAKGHDTIVVHAVGGGDG